MTHPSILRTLQRNRHAAAVIRLGGLGLFLAACSGCVVEEVQRRPRHPTVIVEDAPPPPPVVVESAPPPPEGMIVVEEAPPPPREEIIIERDRPSPRHVWIGGYWSWHAGRHDWVEGRWELPPRANVVWVAPRWEHRDRGYAFVAGSWRDGPASVHARVALGGAVNVHLNYVALPPPPPRHEVVIESQRPSREHVWIKGYYVWRDGRHAWISGHWERPPHPHAVWVEPRWENHPQGHLFISGYWR
ncbi:MAG: hypothetical protein ABI273_02635 [Lacunisphaera sp.]